MNFGLSIIIVILFFICILLIMKIYFTKKSLKEIEMSLNNILKSDTNNLITISSADKNIRNLAINLNMGLKELKKQRQQYENVNQ